MIVRYPVAWWRDATPSFWDPAASVKMGTSRAARDASCDNVIDKSASCVIVHPMSESERRAILLMVNVLRKKASNVTMREVEPAYV